jgi:hypothetical protein
LPQVVHTLEVKNKVMAESLRSQTRLAKVAGNIIYFNTSDMLKNRFEKPQPQTAINEAFSQVMGHKVVIRFVTGAETQAGTADQDAAELLKVAEELGGKVVK